MSGKLLIVGVLSLILQIINTNVTHACSPGPMVSFTNFELVETFDLIVVATAIKEEPLSPLYKVVVFRVDQAIKGNPPKEVFHEEAYLANPQLGDPNELDRPHPDAYIGSCIRNSYRKDGQYVLFLMKSGDGKHKGEYTIPFIPFARLNEDYFGENSLWIKTIRYYLEVQKNQDPKAQLGVLQARHEALTAKEMTIEERLLAADIADHLCSVHPQELEGITCQRE